MLIFQAPIGLLDHNITDPAAAAVDARAAPGAGAAGAAETPGLLHLTVPKDHRRPQSHARPDTGHQCQRSSQPAPRIPAAHGGAEGKQLVSSSHLMTQMTHPLPDWLLCDLTTVTTMPLLTLTSRALTVAYRCRRTSSDVLFVEGTVGLMTLYWQLDHKSSGQSIKHGLL